jgi:enoyl-CoA hydratase/carnithine racemase
VTTLSDYRNRYENIAVSREEGVLEVRLHTNDGPLVWSPAAHRDIGLAFTQIGMDPDNQVVVLSGTGDVFCNELDYRGFQADDNYSWLGIWTEGKRLLQALVDIEVPVVGVVNGPATIHAELVVLSDVVIAADTATFADMAHFVNGAVPGDGVHLVWPYLLGPNRGRYFLLTGQHLTADEAHHLGVVGEVVPASDAYARGREIAGMLAAKPTRTLRYTREILVAPWRRLLHGDALSHGLGLEGVASEVPR